MPLSILVIGRHPELLATVVRLINQQPDWSAKGTSSDEEAMRWFQEVPYDLVLLSNGIEETTEQMLRAFFYMHRPSCKIIQHYGGGSGLLNNEIREAIK